MRVKLRNINKVKKRLADGRVVTLYYAWRGKGAPRLRGKPGSPEFMLSFQEAHAERKKVPAVKETLANLFDAYLDSHYYRKKGERTRKDYKKELDEARKLFGWVPLDTLGTKPVRRDLYAHREELSRKSGDRKADKFWTTLALVLSWGKTSGINDHNPCEKGGRFYHGTRVNSIWPFEVEQDFYERGPKQLAEAMLLAVWTGQRQGDCLEMTWFRYAGKVIRLKQNKTEARVAVPVGGPLREMLDGLKRARDPKPGDTILLSSGGQPWTSAGFQSSFGKATRKGAEVVPLPAKTGSEGAAGRPFFGRFQTGGIPLSASPRGSQAGNKFANRFANRAEKSGFVLWEKPKTAIESSGWGTRIRT